MGGFKNPFGGGNIGTSSQIAGAAVNPFGLIGEIATGGKGAQLMGGLDTSIKDPAGMNQYTDLANQAQQEYGTQRSFMNTNINPVKKDFISDLAARASGKGPSIADRQMKNAFDTSIKNQLALARSTRGTSAGLAQRNAGNALAQQQQNIAGQAAVARMQEQTQAQDALQNAITNEQSYASGTLGAALGSQANVAQMQNAQRDRNDKRNEGGIGAINRVLGLGLANGGMVPKYAKGGVVAKPSSFASALASKPKKLARGGQFYVDTGNNAVARFVNNTNKRLKDKGPLEQMSGGLTGGGFKAMQAEKMEADDELALDGMVDEFEAEDAATAQKSTKIVNPLELGAHFVATAADGGSADDILEKVKSAAKKLADNKFENLKADTQYTPHSRWGIKQVHKRLVEEHKRDVVDSNNYADGGEVSPGEKLINRIREEAADLKVNKAKNSVKNNQYSPTPGNSAPNKAAVEYGNAIKESIDEINRRNNEEFNKALNRNSKGNMSMKKAAGGNVPGEPVVEGDDERNDTFHAMLSPGEVVIPRTIVQEGPVAAAYFTKKATEQEGYNAENYKAEKKPFASMLKEIQDSERTYNKVKNIVKKVR